MRAEEGLADGCQNDQWRATAMAASEPLSLSGILPRIREIRHFGPERNWMAAAKSREINIENVMVTIEVQWKWTVHFNDAFTPIYTNNW